MTKMKLFAICIVAGLIVFAGCKSEGDESATTPKNANLGVRVLCAACQKTSNIKINGTINDVEWPQACPACKKKAAYPYVICPHCNKPVPYKKSSSGVLEKPKKCPNCKIQLFY